MLLLLLDSRSHQPSAASSGPDIRTADNIVPSIQMPKVVKPMQESTFSGIPIIDSIVEVSE